jgi:hypothetical protein
LSDPRVASARAELLGVLETLDEIAALVVDGQEAYYESLDRRQRVRYLWIVVGSRLKNYCQLMGIARAIGVLGQAIGFRHTLAYMRPTHVDDEIVWRTSRDDLEPLRQAVRETERALGPA